MKTTSSCVLNSMAILGQSEPAKARFCSSLTTTRESHTLWEKHFSASCFGLYSRNLFLRFPQGDSYECQHCAKRCLGGQLRLRQPHAAHQCMLDVTLPARHSRVGSGRCPRRSPA